jgi:hypothetical protein
VGTTLTS